MWWRVFIPSWRFFDKPESGAKLFVLINQNWELVDLPLRKGLLSLFFNPVGGLAHARANLFDRLLLEIQMGGNTQDLVSYRLVENIAREFALSKNSMDFKFKLTAFGQDTLVSG